MSSNSGGSIHSQVRIITSDSEYLRLCVIIDEIDEGPLVSNVKYNTCFNVRQFYVTRLRHNQAKNKEDLIITFSLYQLIFRSSGIPCATHLHYLSNFM